MFLVFEDWLLLLLLWRLGTSGFCCSCRIDHDRCCIYRVCMAGWAPWKYFNSKRDDFLYDEVAQPRQTGQSNAPIGMTHCGVHTPMPAFLVPWPFWSILAHLGSGIEKGRQRATKALEYASWMQWHKVNGHSISLEISLNAMMPCHPV